MKQVRSTRLNPAVDPQRVFVYGTAFPAIGEIQVMGTYLLHIQESTLGSRV